MTGAYTSLSPLLYLVDDGYRRHELSMAQAADGSRASDVCRIADAIAVACCSIARGGPCRHDRSDQ
jgi:hypothetical protein